MKTREALRVVLAFVLIASLFAAAAGWAQDRPDEHTWLLRIGGLAVAVAAIGGFLLLAGRRDEAPDYLFQQLGKYFDRDGFCFAVRVHEPEHVATLRVWFQNRCEGPCLARIVLRPSRRLLGRPRLPPIELSVSCEPAAFGFLDQPLVVPEDRMGRTLDFDIGVSVEWPDRRGRTLRFRDAAPIRTDADFRNRTGTMFSALGLLGGMLVLSRAAQVKIRFPEAALSELPPGFEATQQTLWRLGDPPLDAVA